MQFDSEKPDKITRGACNDDKVIFENPLNWTTRSFIFAKQGEYEHVCDLDSSPSQTKCLTGDVES